MCFTRTLLEVRATAAAGESATALQFSLQPRRCYFRQGFDRDSATRRDIGSSCTVLQTRLRPPTLSC
ncbi:unnamed protein product, partial [Amoebophrya sp. A120]|eukprot:GSA120T00019193001.1